MDMKLGFLEMPAWFSFTLKWRVYLKACYRPWGGSCNPEQLLDRAVTMGECKGGGRPSAPWLSQCHTLSGCSRMQPEVMGSSTTSAEPFSMEGCHPISVIIGCSKICADLGFYTRWLGSYDCCIAG